MLHIILYIERLCRVTLLLATYMKVLMKTNTNSKNIRMVRADYLGWFVVAMHPCVYICVVCVYEFAVM